MALKEKVTQEDLILYEVLRNPVLCAEFIYNVDITKYDKPIEMDWYQQEILADFNSYVSICTARATGKTFSIVAKIIWYLIFNIFPNNEILYAVPSKVHMQPVWEGLVRNFRINSFLKNYLPRTQGINSADNTIKLLNGANFISRIAGQSGDGRNFIGLHLPVGFVDEAGYFPLPAFQEMQPIYNTWMTGWQQYVSGVPTGLRENNILYQADRENENYTKHRVSSYDNPRLTEEDEKRAIEQYGGVDSDDFIHLFLGEHGSPIFSVFDRRLFDIKQYPVYKLTIDGIKTTEIADILTKLSLLPPIPKNYGVIFGIDLGYTDPTAIFVLFIESSGVLKFHSKIQLNKVAYPLQEKIIDYLDNKYNPNLIGIDEGAAGKAVIQNLLEGTDYLHKGFNKKITAINFSSMTIIGYDSDGKEIKSRTKPLSVSVLQEYSNNHKIVYSSTDIDTITELERMTYMKSASGDISYRTLTIRGGKRGEDHFTAALLCASLAYYLENELLNFKRQSKILAGTSWLS
jgi:hypothetical protein